MSLSLFFAHGYNKSGTTFLQQLLDSHPRINCPSEHHFTTLRMVLTKGLERYRGTVEAFDSNTARQGIRFDLNRHVDAAFVTLVRSFATVGAGEGVTHIGLNDNSVAHDIGRLARLFPQARFVGIVRDPRAVAPSLWHHRLRTEDAFRASPPERLPFFRAVGKEWGHYAEAMEAARAARPARLLSVRYEDLVGPERQAAVAGILDFLACPSTAEEVAAMIDANDFSARQGAGNGFFRSGRSDGWRSELTAGEIAAVEEYAAPMMARFSYQVG
ncbi:sulfotransferase family protein [Novispirillum sp. DQ9]|uniref:sulfotransferase family protein n=1 Tax=Novispirillum sp. DQ9 TaxID=3398612 RepID=UPI003C7BAA14